MLTAFGGGEGCCCWCEEAWLSLASIDCIFVQGRQKNDSKKGYKYVQEKTRQMTDEREG